MDVWLEGVIMPHAVPQATRREPEDWMTQTEKVHARHVERLDVEAGCMLLDAFPTWH